MLPSCAAINLGLSVVNLGSFIYEQSGQQAFANCKKWKVEAYRDKMTKIITVFDWFSCARITGSLIPEFAKRVSFVDIGKFNVLFSTFLFVAANVAAIYATKHSLNLHSHLHSDIYKKVSDQLPQTDSQSEESKIETEVGMSGSDFAQQSIHVMRSIVDFTACCLIKNLSPVQRNVYFLSTIINSLSVGVIFQRVSLLFRLPEMEKEPCAIVDKDEQVIEDLPLEEHKVLLKPIIEYRIFRSFFDQMVMKKGEEDQCPVCLEILKERVAICPRHNLHAECVYQYCLNKLKDSDFQDKLGELCEGIVIKKEGAYLSPTATFFESLGCPSRAADKMSIWLVDNKINETTRKEQLVRYDNRINPCRCALCQVHSPFFDFQVEATTMDHSKLPVEVSRDYLTREQLKTIYGNLPFLPKE